MCGVYCRAVETFCICKILISDVSVAGMLCDQAAALEAVLYSGSRRRRKSSYSFLFFNVISFDWTSLNAVSDSEVFAKDNSGATFPKDGVKMLYRNLPKEKNHQLNCDFKNGYCRYEQPFTCLQTSHSS